MPGTLVYLSMSVFAHMSSFPLSFCNIASTLLLSCYNSSLSKQHRQQPHLSCCLLQPLLVFAEEFKRLKMLICGGKGGGGMMKNMPKNLQKGMAGMNPHNMQMNMAQMSKMLPPHVLKQMGGPGALQGLMRQMEGMK